MSTQDFIRAPWKHSHSVFEKSLFNIRPAPEFSTGEVMLSSLYRAIGFKEIQETQGMGRSSPIPGEPFWIGWCKAPRLHNSLQSASCRFRRWCLMQPSTLELRA